MPPTSSVRPRTTPTSGTSRQPPRVLRLAGYAALVVAAVHLVALALLLTHQGVIRASVLADHPGLTGTEIDRQTRSLVLQSLVPHVVLPVILGLRASRILTGRARGRGLLTAVLVVQVLAHATLPMSMHELPGYAAPLIAVQAFSLVFEVTALVLLWRRPARDYFARRAGRAR